MERAYFQKGSAVKSQHEEEVGGCEEEESCKGKVVYRY